MRSKEDDKKDFEGNGIKRDPLNKKKENVLKAEK